MNLQDIVIKEISLYLKCQPGEISVGMKLEELGIDSLGAITILYELEDQLDIEVPNDIFGSLKIVQDIVDHLEKIMDGSKPE